VGHFHWYSFSIRVVCRDGTRDREKQRTATEFAHRTGKRGRARESGISLVRPGQCNSRGVVWSKHP
jgi:hypothetical protein